MFDFSWQGGDETYKGIPNPQEAKPKAYNANLAALKTVSELSGADEASDVTPLEHFQRNKAMIDMQPDYAFQETISNYRSNLSNTIARLSAAPNSGMTPSEGLNSYNQLAAYIQESPINAPIRAGLDALGVDPEHEAEYILQKKLTELNGDKGFLSDAGDFLGSFIPFREGLSVSEVGGQTIGKTQFENLVIAYRTEKDPKKKAEIARWVTANIDSVTDNESIKSNILSQFVGSGNPRDYTNSVTAMDAMELTPVGLLGDVTSLGTAVARSNNLARRAVQAGDATKAGTINAVAAMDDVAAEATGTTRAAAILNGIGFKNEQVFAEVVDGISNDTVRAVAGRLQLDNMEVQQELVDQLSKLDDVLDVSTLSDEDYTKAILERKHQLVSQQNSIVGPNLPRISVEDISEVSRGGGKFELKVTVKPSVSSGMDDAIENTAINRLKLDSGEVLRVDTMAGKVVNDNAVEGATGASRAMFAKVDDVGKAVLAKAHRASLNKDTNELSVFLKQENGRYSKEADHVIKLDDSPSIGASVIDVGDTKYLGKGKGSFISSIKHRGVIQSTPNVSAPAQSSYSYTASGNVTLDHLGGWELENMATPELMANTFLSPMKSMENIAKGDGSTIGHIVEKNELNVAATDRRATILKDAYARILKNIPKKDWNDVGELLRESTLYDNGKGRRIPLQELMNRGYKEGVIKAYYNTMLLNDATANLRAWMRFQEWDMRGYKQIKLNNNEFNVGEVYSTQQGATNAMALWKKANEAETTKMKVYSVSHNSMLDESRVRSMVAKGDYDLVWLKTDAIKAKGVGKVDMVLVRKDAVESLNYNPNVFKTIDGYSPIIRREAHYAVVEKVRETVNGVVVERKRIHTISPSLSMAKKAVDDAVAKAGEAGERIDLELIKPSDKGAKFIDDTEEGKLYYGHRADHEFAKLAQAAEIVDPIKAIGQNLEQLGRLMSQNSLRMEMAERFKKTAEQLPGNERYTLSTPIDGASDAHRKLEYIRKYAVAQLSVPDKNTDVWTSTNRRIAEWIDGEWGNNKVSRTLLKAAQIDPVTTMKSTAFHAMLGWFNPSQLFVQAMNMSIAATMHPILTVKNAPKAIALLIGQNRDADSLIRYVAKATGLDPDEMADVHKQFLRAGIRDSVKSTADMEAGIHGFGHAADAFKKAADAGLIFYRQGEMSGRTVGYMVAREKYLNQVGKTWKELTDADHTEIFNMFQNLTLNLSKANKTPFQYGIASLPTQFWHVQTKYMELLFGRKFTTTEKLRLVTGQAMLFGAAGVPFGKSLADWWAKDYKDEQGQYTGPIDEDVLKQGMFGMLFDGDLALADRAGLGDSLESWYKLAFDESNKTLIETFMGASGVLWKRGSDAAKFTEAFASDELPEQATAMTVFREWLNVVSTASNATKAFEMNNFHARMNSKYEVLYKDPTSTEIIGKMLGFESQRYLDLYDGINQHYARQEALNTRADFFIKTWLKSVEQMPQDSTAVYDEFKNRLIVLSRTIENEYDRNEFQKIVLKRILEGKDKESHFYKQMMKNAQSDFLGGMTTGDAFNRMYGKTGE